MPLCYRESGSGEPLLLLHGFTGCSDDWKHVFAEPLAGHRVITPDLPGHGRSPNPRHDFKFADVSRDVFALLDHLGIDRVKAIGMSAGANTLLHMATAQPQRVVAMIHVSGTPRFPDQARAIMKTMTEEGRSPAEWAEMRGRHHLGDDQIRALWRHAREFADDRDDMNFTAATLVHDHRKDPDRARRSRSALSGRAGRRIVSRDSGCVAVGRAERRPRTDLRRAGRAVRQNGHGLSRGP